MQIIQPTPVNSFGNAETSPTVADKPLPEPNASFADQVFNWLANQGYPLEMEVASAFDGAGFTVMQAEYYTDAGSGSQREIDVVAYMQRSTQDVLHRISFVVECKISRDKPWVLFTAPGDRLAARARVAQRAASRTGRTFLKAISARADIQELELMQLGERAGYGVTQAFTTGADVTYAALSSVTKATWATIEEADEASIAQGWAVDVVFPVIVIDGALFEYFLTRAGPALSHIQSGVLAWRNPVIGMPHTFVHLVTRQSLPSFLRAAETAATHLLGKCDVELNELISKLGPHAAAYS